MLQAFFVSNSPAQRNSLLKRLFSTKHPSFVDNSLPKCFFSTKHPSFVDNSLSKCLFSTKHPSFVDNSLSKCFFSTKHPSFVEKRGEAVGMRKGKIVDKFVVAQLDVSGEKFYFVKI